MRLAIMQPYIFPYIGYFQLIRSIDKFVIYDDVNYIKQGWINRNRILLNNSEHLFTIPLNNASSFNLINNVTIHERLYKSWKEKFYRTVTMAYKKAPYFEAVYSILTGVLDKECQNIAELATSSINATIDYLELSSDVVPTSAIYRNKDLSGRERVIDICQRERATTYINAVGGMELYSKNFFEQSQILLQFIRPGDVRYRQFGDPFVPWLSIIDVMMFNSINDIGSLLDNFTLI